MGVNEVNINRIPCPNWLQEALGEDSLSMNNLLSMVQRLYHENQHLEQHEIHDLIQMLHERLILVSTLLYDLSSVSCII